MGIEGTSWTRGQQGGIGYPPQLVRYKRKWYWVEDSRNHGGSVCPQCSKDRNIEYGFMAQRFDQPRPYGSQCYRSLCPHTKSIPRDLRGVGSMSWQQFVTIIKREKGEPVVMSEATRVNGRS